jgi:exonuclease SbcD
MKIIHTADWHLCDRLGHKRVNRTADLCARVEAVAALCEEHGADVLLIAGDLFSEQATVEEMAAALTHLHGAFAAFFRHGGTILAITGNHDHEARVDMLRAGMWLAAPPSPDSRRFSPGRMYLLNRPYFGTLDAADGDRAQFVLVPYPTVSHYAEASDLYRSKEEENRLLVGRVAEWVKSVSTHADFDARLPTVLAAHLHVRGADLNNSRFVPTEREALLLEPSFLPPTWAYVALGHIHKPQALGGQAHVRYPGSLDRLAFDERADDKGILLCDLGPTGLRGEPKWLPLPGTALYEVRIADAAAELPVLAERYPDRAAAIFRVTVANTGDGLSREEVHRALMNLFPRHTEIAWDRPITADGDTRPNTIRPQADHRNTVREFLAQKLENDPDKQAVLDLAETFLNPITEAAP